MNQVKAWCGAELPSTDRKAGAFSDDEPLSKRIKREPALGEEDLEMNRSPQGTLVKCSFN